jgi:hypothetical protein
VNRLLCILVILVSIALAISCKTMQLDEVIRGTLSPSGELNESTIVAGLKEALSVGTRNAVDDVSKRNGYFDNPSIKILMPEEMHKVADTLERIGFGKLIDDFVHSMNRAAERAAPKAKAPFIRAVREMTFEDARQILQGQDTAATEYFKGKTYDELYVAFNPIISDTMGEVGVTRYYQRMTRKIAVVTFLKPESFDLDHYVTEKSLDGLFYVLGEEEKRIRTDPAARVTELLRKVFSGR